jgi:hypothetical protein
MGDIGKRMRDEGGGVYRMLFFAPEDGLPLLLAAMGGDQLARAYCRAIPHVIMTPDLCCLLCGADVAKPPTLIGFLNALRDDPSDTVTCVICASCQRLYPTRTKLNAAVVEFLRANLMPDLRVLPPAHLAPAGTA